MNWTELPGEKRQATLKSGMLGGKHWGETSLSDWASGFAVWHLPRRETDFSSHTLWQEAVLEPDTVQFSSVAQSCPTLCSSMDCSMPGLPVHHQLPELAQTHVYRVGDAIQLSQFLSSLSPPASNLSQHQGLFKWVSSLHQVAKVLELQL